MRQEARSCEMVTQEGVFLAGKDACLGELGDVVRRILSKIFGLLWGEMCNLMQGIFGNVHLALAATLSSA